MEIITNIGNIRNTCGHRITLHTNSTHLRHGLTSQRALSYPVSLCPLESVRQTHQLWPDEAVLGRSRSARSRTVRPELNSPAPPRGAVW